MAAGPGTPLGILAGGGGVPIELAANAVARGRRVHILAIVGEARQAEIAAFPHTWVRWGAIGHILRTLRDQGCRELVIVGSVRRPDLGKLRPDLGFVLSLPVLVRLLFGGDDSVLTRVVRFFEGKGFVVRGVHEIAPDLLVAAGPRGTHRPRTGDLADMRKGFGVVGALGTLDVGQAAVVAHGRVVAIEGAEGTDRMLERARLVLAQAQGQDPRPEASGVLVKRPKPGQELRVDMPAIGPRTVALAGAAGLAGIAVEAGKVLMAERDTTVAAAEDLGLFVSGVAHEGADAAEPCAARDEPRALDDLSVLTRRRLGKGAMRDVRMGLETVRRLQPFGTGRAAVVMREYVVAVEAAEGTRALLERCTTLRQWGRMAAGRRLGVLVVASDRGGGIAPPQSADEVVDMARQVGLAGVVWTPAAADLAPAAIERARAAGMFLAIASAAAPCATTHGAGGSEPDTC
ncbi:MAG: UDP-2,3-diacylglucosamine diphosphatase LpxI [Hyphomicrobiaceae bacterium]